MENIGKVVGKVIMEIEEISLLYFVALVNYADLAEVLSKYTGCDKEVYTQDFLIDRARRAAADITRAHHIPGFLFNLYEAQDRIMTYNLIYRKVYDEKYGDEIGAIRDAFLCIKIKTFTEEEQKIMKELYKEYIEK